MTEIILLLVMIFCLALKAFYVRQNSRNQGLQAHDLYVNLY